MHIPLPQSSRQPSSEAAVESLVHDPLRLAVVRESGLLDSAPEAAFDAMTRLAAKLLNVPFSFMSVMDAGRVFYKSHCGFTAALTVPALVAGALTYGALTFGKGGSSVDGSVDYRAQLWQRGLEEFRERPLLGDSYRDVVARMPDLIQGEGMVDFVNSYLYFALLVGLLGLVMFILFLGVPSVRIWLARRKLAQGRLELDVAAFCFGALVSAAVMFALTSFIPRAALLVMIVTGFAGALIKPLGNGPPLQSRAPWPSA